MLIEFTDRFLRQRFDQLRILDDRIEHRRLVERHRKTPIRSIDRRIRHDVSFAVDARRADAFKSLDHLSGDIGERKIFTRANVGI